ncbi:asparaginyl/glutamyl-tRNA amidotransferase subunit C [Fructilactobacillus lindneri]|uniref:Aspartyl/glutamyl-tRNA(Asn/Gln) amidotransferase subunit C n=2 Tax=Fructilactobacillus lindneri TaxID=53444 RepID=A0A0R2JMZ7_9LACO|nr:Asp-tRNA(Asn)/Glu-tRNA(Gln) amidotransferase subunit GatC [Fructilactobacillus lindneri]ANZ57962.1 asparaginyl/glutamyl-tRNA amidotransferase subunit C [Fructilactobacillus lindneri]ANZ59232.1 asparaginyl/glutamyl-tRNA amidotransferase subunit C [Fructilactobacillus lindneri]KRN78563.1 aspartyl glutamyl-tRNA amidotransferase subunit C [Fructilactobacillus lindneri DSM 20690 = JCM 11027]POG98283.1 asparaginyl/glutamyl-tRNA amidotransferase subunit C [Fructilactobacillus lindneri]POH01600.1 a
MTEKVNEEKTQHIAGLAKLSIDKEDLPKFTEQLNDMLEMLDEIDTVDTDGVEPTYTVTDRINVMREDVADNWGQRDALLHNAPEAVDGLIRVPTIIDESEDK